MKFKPITKPTAENKVSIKDIKFVKITALFPVHTSENAESMFETESLANSIMAMTCLQSENRSDFLKIEEAPAEISELKKFVSQHSFDEWEITDSSGEHVCFVHDLFDKTSKNRAKKKDKR